eukprot:CAMPEP_0168357292 /NCGR_PEP_ID=MMETSP0228-20121227/511_1 /TAXON_ID=133427 /ORGANISM="Protoceratium reticulatum, Strain CCCM 535 (=CCMP 1889)" /LENGTH=215 /DNA_ID=CAMNT_0008369805 /DNA_START=30 /DNA_END=674 /DNA_ORIENTATION=-
MKPDNIVLEDAGERLHIIDYGFMEHATEDLLRSLATKECAFKGTRGYFPPEVLGKGTYGRQWSFDVYSLGIMMLTMDNGASPTQMARLISRNLVENKCKTDTTNITVEDKDEQGKPISTEVLWPKQVSDIYYTHGIMFPIRISKAGVCTVAPLENSGGSDEDEVLTIPITYWLELAEGLRGQFWIKHKGVLLRMLHENPTQRPSPQEILQDLGMW